jgi:hypothetical protein
VFRATITPGLNDSDGISIDPNPIGLPNGATIRDASGNDAVINFPGLAANTAYKVDTNAPSLSINAVTGDDVVNLSDKTAGVILSGTSDELGGTVAVQWGSQSLSTTVGSDGRWQITPSTLPADGAAALSASVSDAAGNTTSAQRSTRLDTVAPTLTLVTPLTNGAGVAGNADNVLNRAEYDAAIAAGGLSLAGTSDAEANSPVALLLNGKTYTTTVQNGQWQLTIPSAD